MAAAPAVPLPKQTLVAPLKFHPAAFSFVTDALSVEAVERMVWGLQDQLAFGNFCDSGYKIGETIHIRKPQRFRPPRREKVGSGEETAGFVS
jgi:hypothetical protein